MPKKVECTAPRCGGRRYANLGFNNKVTHGEFIHNLDYQTRPPHGTGRAFFVDQQQQTPGTKKRPIKPFS